MAMNVEETYLFQAHVIRFDVRNYYIPLCEGNDKYTNTLYYLKQGKEQGAKILWF